jgi:hypothetical protein
MVYHTIIASINQVACILKVFFLTVSTSLALIVQAGSAHGEEGGRKNTFLSTPHTRDIAMPKRIRRAAGLRIADARKYPLVLTLNRTVYKLSTIC